MDEQIARGRFRTGQSRVNCGHRRSIARAGRNATHPSSYRERASLAKLRGNYLDYGALERFSHIRMDTQALSEELTERRITHTVGV